MALPAFTPEPDRPVPTPATAVPDGPELLQLEQRARRLGSGLTIQELQGEWRLEQVWPKGSPQPQRFSGVLLRGLGAQLAIRPGAGEEAGPLRIENSVRLGALELRFSGAGRLRGARPLLEFWFEQLELRLGSTLLLARRLGPVEPRRLPFFALIGASRPAAAPGLDPDPGPAAAWLAARGRGGGLALWRLARP